jgi:K+-sensing histidine kinase KdpD
MRADQFLNAHEQVEKLATRELREAEETIMAQERLHGFTEEERRRDEEQIAARGRVDQITADELRQRDDILAAVLSLNSRMRATEFIGHLFEAALDTALRIFNADRGFIARRENAGANMRVVVEKGYAAPSLKGLPDQGPGVILEKLFPKGSAGAQNAASPARHEGTQDTGYAVHVLLTCEGRTCGVIYLERTSGKKDFSSTEGWFLSILASQLSVGCDKVLLQKEFHQQHQELRKMVMLKNNFIAHFSSDFRNPMEDLEKLIRDGTDKSRREALELAGNIRGSIEKTWSLFSLQQEVNEAYSQKIRIDALVRDIVASFQKEIQARDLSVEIDFSDGLVPFDSNRDTIYTILDEIICNAIVYNRKGGKVRIIARQENNTCRVYISDTGVGISKENLGKIFDRFYRAETSNDLHDRGAGLGLYIVRNFIEAYGGSISFTSDEGKGSDVILSFPT